MARELSENIFDYDCYVVYEIRPANSSDERVGLSLGSRVSYVQHMVK